MRTISRLLAVAALFALLVGPVAADTLDRGNVYPHFSNNNTGPVYFTWVSPVPPGIVITRYNGGYNSNPSQQVIYSGPAPGSLTLQGGGTYGGGRFTIRSANNSQFRVRVSGPNVVNF